jgi:hypothetical protein
MSAKNFDPMLFRDKFNQTKSSVSRDPFEYTDQFLNWFLGDFLCLHCASVSVEIL